MTVPHQNVLNKNNSRFCLVVLCNYRIFFKQCFNSVESGILIQSEVHFILSLVGTVTSPSQTDLCLS